MVRVRQCAALLVGAFLLVFSACGGKQGGTRLPPPEGFGEPDHLEPMEGYDEVTQPNVSDGSGEADEGGDRAPKGEPVFTDNMSVDEAIEAAKGSERVNIDQEVLGHPLTQPALYEPCKLKQTDHFKLRVAIWNGRAVGIDLETKNAALKTCITEQLKALQWRDKVKSLNIVEYEM